MIAVVYAVQDIVILFRALAVGVEVARACAMRALRRSCAGGQLSDINPIAAAEWNFVDGLSVCIWEVVCEVEMVRASVPGIIVTTTLRCCCKFRRWLISVVVPKPGTLAIML
jgi:hypothetical protein